MSYEKQNGTVFHLQPGDTTGLNPGNFSVAYSPKIMDLQHDNSTSSFSENENDNELGTDTDANDTPTHSKPGSMSGLSPSLPVPMTQDAAATAAGTSPLALPRLSRAFSMPLPSQLGRLQNPYASGSTSSERCLPDAQQTPAQNSLDYHAFLPELTDTLQMAIQTLLQLSPPQMLDPVKEQLSSCFLSVPTTSMSSLLTLMKNLNYLVETSPSFLPNINRMPEPPNSDEFDIAELLQAVGDAVSGIAAHFGVDLVLYHGDVGLKHVLVKGDECGLSCILSHLLRQLIATSSAGDSIEVGLVISPSTNSTENGSFFNSFLPPDDNPLLTSFRITHRFPKVDRRRHDHLSDIQIPVRSRPNFQAASLSGLLSLLGASLHSEEHDHSLVFYIERYYRLDLSMRASNSHIDSIIHLSEEQETTRQPFPDLNLAREPSLNELAAFTEVLKGKKVAFHASTSGAFAHRLTSYLTAWGMDISHMSTDGDTSAIAQERSQGISLDSSTITGYSSGDNAGSSFTESSIGIDNHFHLGAETPLAEDDGKPPNFIIIDDDIAVLRQQIIALRQHCYSVMRDPRKRPPLTHRSKSSPHTPPINANASIPIQPEYSVTLVHFTSLANYRPIRDLIQSFYERNSVSMCDVPDIVAIPKPAGPRRLLTALYTAVNKPVVDPLFSPIATSPSCPSPARLVISTPVPSRNDKMKSTGTPPEGRSRSDRNTRSPREHLNGATLPPSPLSMEIESTGYFPDSIHQLGSTPSSGVLIQSPDGQPAGIYFQPRMKSLKHQISSGGSYMQRATAASEDLSGISRKTLALPAPQKQNLKPLPLSMLRSKTSPNVPPISLSPVTSSPDVIKTPSKQRAMSSSLAESMGPRNTVHSREISSDHITPIFDHTTQTDPSLPLNHTKVPVSTIPSERKPKSPLKRGKPSEYNIVPPINVLIVEDNPINQTILTTFMKRKKIKYDTALNGQEAIDKFKSGVFHLILMDIQMPVMDGIQATREIRRLETMTNASPQVSSADVHLPISAPKRSSETRSPGSAALGSSVIIVALTASSLQSDRVNALAAGCNDFLTKPVSLVWLNNKIIEWGSLKALQMYASGSSVFSETVAAAIQLRKGPGAPASVNTSQSFDARLSQSEARPSSSSTEATTAEKRASTVSESNLLPLKARPLLKSSSPEESSSSDEAYRVANIVSGGKI